MNKTLLFIIILIIICIILIISAILLSIKLGYNYLFLNKEYTKSTKENIEKYADCVIVDAYIVRETFSDWFYACINYLTWGKLKYIIDTYQYNKPYHISLLLHLDNNKCILVEKTHNINVTETIHFNEYTELKRIKVNKNMGIKIKKLLEDSRKRLGNDMFYNWQLTNNCQEFAKELLITMNKYTKSNATFMLSNNRKLLNKIRPSKMIEYILNIILYVYNANPISRR